MVLLVVAVLSVVAGLVGFLVVRHWPKADPALSCVRSDRGKTPEPSEAAELPAFAIGSRDRDWARAHRGPDRHRGVGRRGRSVRLDDPAGSRGGDRGPRRRTVGRGAGHGLHGRRARGAHAPGRYPDDRRVASWSARSGCGAGAGRPSPVPAVGRPRSDADLEHDQGCHRPRPPGAASACGVHGHVLPERSHDRRHGHLPGGCPRPCDRQLAEGACGARWRRPGDRRRGRVHQVLLGVHFFSDALAGFAIGLSWFGLCAVAFGGRLLSFGAPAQVAASPTLRPPPVSPRVGAGRDPPRWGVTHRRNHSDHCVHSRTDLLWRVQPP